MLYNKEQVQEMTLTEAQRALRAVELEFNVDGDILDIRRHWDLLDDICSSMLYLEDHIQRLNNPTITSLDHLKS